MYHKEPCIFLLLQAWSERLVNLLFAEVTSDVYVFIFVLFQTKRLNAFKKFAVLWHLTRNMKADSTLGHEARTFDRSVF